MKVFYVIIWSAMLMVVATSATYANSAQPGFWNAGGTGTFSLLFPEDSVAYKKVQMVRELVAIQLYPGYAVVKGSYWMHNTTNDSLSLRAGYPLYGEYETEGQHSDKMQISFDSLSAMRVLLDKIPVEEYTIEPQQHEAYWQLQDWYVFQTHFGPLDTLLIEVYFILNTNNTSITQGYTRDKSNGFIYLLETGATWKQPIIQGEVRLQMMDGLQVEDIHGLAPDSVFSFDKDSSTLVYSFTNLYPNHESNIVVAYHEEEEALDFAKVIAQQDALYKTIETFASQPTPTNVVAHKFGNPYEVHSTNWSMNLFFIGIILIPVLAIGAFVYLVYRTVKYEIGRRKQKNSK